MNKNREIKRPNGQYILLERAEFAPDSVLIKGGKVVNEKGYKIYLERQKQAHYVPTEADIARAKEANPILPTDLENKVDKLTALVEKLLNEK